MGAGERRKIAEGKTKIIWTGTGPGDVLVESKDDITAGDGLRRDTIPDKAALSTATTTECFRLLSKAGVPHHFLLRCGPTTFHARSCAMIPIELVARRLATGSYLKRNPAVPEGHVFSEPEIEFYLKDDRNHDPLVQPSADGSAWLLYDAKRPLDAGPVSTMPFHAVTFGLWQIDHIFVQRLQALLTASFLALEKAWAQQRVTLCDLKIECGVALDGSYDLLVADVIDNDNWRIWPEGDKSRMRDKQVYRDTPQLTPEALAAIRDNYAWVAVATKKF